MRYYIVKAQSVSVNEKIVDGIMESDKCAVFVNAPDDCDVAVLQKGFTRSKCAVAEMKRLRESGKPCVEGNLYLERCRAKISK